MPKVSRCGITFTVDSPILGYRASARRAFEKKYHEYKRRVLLLAMQAGFPNTGRSEKAAPPSLGVWVYWKKEPRIDWKNVYGAVEDALWYEQDRYVLPVVCNSNGVTWDSGEEKAVVSVAWVPERARKRPGVERRGRLSTGRQRSVGV